MSLPAMFILGLLGSGHCVGMCGGFAVTIGAAPRKIGAALLNQLAYSVGRLFTYGFLGALAGLIGGSLARANLPLVEAQRVLAFVAGVAMLYIGLSSLGLLRVKWPAGSGGAWASFLGQFINSRGLGPFMLAGVFTGFLPCGLVYAALAGSMMTGKPMQGWLSMICFGAGTIPAMVALGCGSTVLSKTMRAGVLKLAACFVLVLGAVTLYRGFAGRSCCVQGQTAHAAFHRHAAEGACPSPATGPSTVPP